MLKILELRKLIFNYSFSFQIPPYFTVIGPKQIIEQVRKNPNYSKLARAQNNAPWWQRPLHSLHRIRTKTRKNGGNKQATTAISTPVSDMHECLNKLKNNAITPKHAEKCQKTRKHEKSMQNNSNHAKNLAQNTVENGK